MKMSQNNGTNEPQLGRIEFNQAVDESIELNKGKAFQYRDHDEMSMTDCEGKKVTIQYHWDTDIFGTMEIVMRLLIANGFLPETVKNGFSYMWNEFYMDDAKESENESMVEFVEWVQETKFKDLSPSQIVELYNSNNTPDGICNDCGTGTGKKADEGCTWWVGMCESCGRTTEVTDERDYR